MRRTALLTIGVSTLLVIAGAAGAAEAVSWRNPATASFTPPQTASVPAGPGVSAQEAPQMVGTVEAIRDQVLGAMGRRSTTLRYPGSDYVKVHFKPGSVRPNDKVTVADPTNAESFTYTGQELAEADNWATSVSGDTAVVSMQPADNDVLGLPQLAPAQVSVDKVARGLTDQEKAREKTTEDAENAKSEAAVRGETGREESICGHSNDTEDAACYKSSDPVAYAHSKPVARLLINGVELCTAWRVGPNNRMFTNHHCFSQTGDARDTEVWFNYECSKCGGRVTQRPTKVRGDRVLATDDTLDYTLFSVQNFNAISRFGYLTLDVRDPARGEELYIPQHPRGDPTVIAMEDPGERSGNCEVANPMYDGYASNTDVSYYCDTDGGSSGSPVISRRTNEVIALHHFGGCPNSGVRVDLIYREVKNLL
jgi:lysyl endopeptidase